MKNFNKFFFIGLSIVLTGLFIPERSFATVFAFNITLSGGQEVPSNPSTGTGTLTGTYDDVTNMLSFNVVFSALVSTTSDGHFHGPAAPGVSTGVAIGFAGFPLGVTSGSYSNSYTLTATQETQLLSGLWYINIHSTASPAGEIRGQLYVSRPVITSFTPANGTVGTSIIITGTDFNAVPADNIVYFGAVRAAVTSGTTTSLTVTVPAGTTYQPISVLDNNTGYTGYSSKPFIITFTNPFGTGIPANFYLPKVDFSTGTNPRNVATADFDGDGKPDLVITNGNSNTLSVLRNTSNPGIIDGTSFAAKVDFASGTFTAHVTTGDVDGDGKPDLVVINNNNISILRNTSTPGIIDASSFAAKVDFDLVFTGPVFVAIADLDGDGKPDLVAVNSGSASVSVLRNTSTPGIINATSFAPKVNFTTGTTPFSIAIGDLDGDGKPDLAVANSGVAANTISVLRNTSITGVINASSFAAKVDFTTGALPRSIAMGDLDGDGKPDLVAANSAAVATTLSVFHNTSTAGVINASSFAAKVDFTTGTSPQSVAIGDLDGDGKPDLATANIVTTNMSVFRNASTPGTIDPSSFAAKVDFTTGTSPVSVAMVDVDGDGITEVVTANGTASSVSVFQVDLSVIPVTLTNVKAYQKNAGIQIEWSTQQEINIHSYEVERSQNGRQFFKLGTVQAIGNSSVVLNYDLFDPNPFKGVSFYRIKIIEAGQITYSHIIKVNISNGYGNMITIYPNPVNDNNIALQVNLPKGIYIISLTNKQGQLLLTKLIDHAGGSVTENIQPSKTLAAGIYQLNITGEGINISEQLIKK